MGKRLAAAASPAMNKRQHSRKSLAESANTPNITHNNISKPPSGAPYEVTAADTWIAIGNCAISMGIIVAAIQAFELALNHAPSSVDALVGWSHLLRMNDINMNDTAGSQLLIQRLNAVAESHPEVTNSASFFRELTECYLLVGLNEQAHQAIQQAIQRSPNDPALQLLLAQTLIRAGARAQAAAALNHCLMLLPPLLAEFSKADIETARSAHAELAAIAAADGNIDLLIIELTATLLLPPPPLARQHEHVALWCAFATAKERANKITEALEACERAEVAVGALPRILITHAYLLLLDEDPEKARKAVLLLSRVVESEREELKAQTRQNLKLDEVDDSDGDFLPWYLLGKAHTVLDSPRAAYDCYQVALRRASNLPITWLAVGKLYLELKQLPDALAAYSQALRLQLNENLPGTAAAWEGLSCVYERCDDQLGDAADASSRAAMCFRAIGDTENAARFEDKSKKLQAAADGKGPVPTLSLLVGVPNFFLRDLVTLLPSERIVFVQGHNPEERNQQNVPLQPAQQPPPSLPPAAHTPLQPPRRTLGPSEASVTLLPPPQHLQHHQPPASSQGSPPIQPAASAPAYSHSSPHPPVPQQPQESYSMYPAPFKPIGKLADNNSHLPPPHSRAWSPQDHIPQPQQLFQGPPPPFAQPPNGIMNSPTNGPVPPGPQTRSPVNHPQMIHNGYAVHGPPGYVYGQYMPMHQGVLAQLQPQGSNWRQ